MEETSFTCLACYSKSPKLKLAVPDFEYSVIATGVNYVCCVDCESWTQVPMPSDQALNSFYPKSYHSFLPASFLSRYRQKMRVRRLQKQLPPGLKAPTILDFGCGQGMFLDALAERFPEGRFFGYEIADQDKVEKRFGGRVTIYRGGLGLLSSIGPVDTITLNHVIEHMPEPLSTMRALKALLRPEGILEGQTPNSDSYERRWLGRRWSGFHAPRHTVIFSRKGLVTLLTKAGYSEVQLCSAMNPANWAISFGSLLQNPERPVGIKRSGVRWLSLVIMAVIPSLMESFTKKAGYVDFHARCKS